MKLHHLALIVLVAPFALAEPAPKVVPVKTEAPTAVPPAAGGATGAGIQPTRLIDGPVDQQLELLRSRIAINAKERGPFGLNQDPGKQGSVFKLPPRRKQELVKTPFVEVIRAVPVAAVFPTEQEFMIGSRTIRTGDTFPLEVRKQKIMVRIESVRSTGIVFKDLKSGERATKRLDLFPEGITPGGKIQPIVGVTPSGRASEEPVRIEISSLPPANPTRSP